MGNVRNLDLTATLTAAMSAVAARTGRVVRHTWAAIQVRLNLGGTATRTDFVGAPVIPTVRYRDVPAAIDWLCRAFAMQVHRVVTDAHGTPRYAELTVGNGMLMVAPIEDTAFGKLMVQPDEIGGVETQVCYLCVGNARAHHARAKAAGAVIIIDPEDDANRGRGYSCRDPEGHVWNFGTYDPWRRQPSTPARAAWGLGRVQQAMVALLVLTVGATLVMELLPQPSARAGTAVAEVEPAAPPAAARLAAVPAIATPAGAEPAVETAGASAASVPEALTPGQVAPAAPITGEPSPPEAAAPSQRQAALAAAELAAASVRSELEEARSALAKAQREASATRAQLEELRRAKAAAERSAAEARSRLAAAQETVERAKAETAAERSRRIAAVRKAIRARQRARGRRTGQRVTQTWCYSAAGLPTGLRRGARLSGFCRS